MNWIKSTLSTVAGTQEPEYGPSAIQSVAAQTETTPYTELEKKDLRWRALEYTNVETQQFYLMADDGTLAMVQLIYSNVVGIHTTVQFNSKIFETGGPGKHLWCSDPLANYGFDEDQTSFYADNVAITLDEEGSSYTVKSAINEDCIVNLTFTRTSPGFQVGKDGTSNFGTDPQNPWGSMRHCFWPRCKVEGTMITKEKEYNMKGKALFIMALQGMKPHHAAAKWNFLTFQGPTTSAVMMEFTTPPSYGTTTVNVGGLARDGEIIYAGASNSATHTSSAQDAGNEWPEPKAIELNWKGHSKDGKEVTAILRQERHAPEDEDRRKRVI
ncbi:MAG: hypothetical protein Q9227_004473 [Pyrenula ochraceoflavens]